MTEQALYFDTLEELEAYEQQQPQEQALYFDTLEELEAYESSIQPPKEEPPASATPIEPQEQAPDVEEKPGFWSNTARGLGERVAKLPSSLASATKKVGDSVAIKTGLSPFWLKYSKALDTVSQLEDVVDLGYEPRATWQGVKQADGFIDTTKAGAAFVTEQGIGSIPDMVAAIYALPAYVVARSGEIGEERAINDGKAEADAMDVIEAAPFALASAILERFGAKGITQAGANQISKNALNAGATAAALRITQETGKAASKESITEAAQEGVIEYLGETLGTQKALDFWEALDRGLAGAVAGGGIGGVGGGVTATGREIADAQTPEIQFAREMQRNVNASTLAPEAPIDNAKRVQGLASTESMLGLVNERLISKGLPPIINEPTYQQPSVSLGGVPPSNTPTEQNVDSLQDSTLSDAGLEMDGLQVVEAPIDELTLSDDVPQFKTGADESGVVEPLGGSFERTGVAPIQVWVRSDGRKEVISGRHRLDLAKRSGESSIPAQYHYESEGFGVDQAATLDALLNIREGQGEVRDYVQFIEQSGLTEEEADAEGILARSTGKRAFAIATKGSDALIASHASGEISDLGATKIAEAAPNNESLQAVGIKAIQDGKSVTIAENMVKAVQAMKVKPSEANGDLFGFDDSALIQAEEMARKASKIQQGIQDRIRAVRGAANNPQAAKKLGVNVKNPEAVREKISQLEAEKRAWNNWPTNKKLVSMLQGEADNASQPTLNPVEVERIKSQDGSTDIEATLESLPPVRDGYTRLFRGSSETVKFDDVFDREKLADFKPTDLKGDFYTDELSYADYYRETYGPDARLTYIDVPTNSLSKVKASDGYVIDVNNAPSDQVPKGTSGQTKARFQFDPSTKTDPGKAQEILNSIREAELLLSGGKNSIGKRYSPAQLRAIERSIENAKKKLDAIPDRKKPPRKKAKPSNAADSLMFRAEDTFNAPGNTYVPTYESASEGLPERREVISLDGKRHKVPRVQRMEPIQAGLTRIIGRRTYYRHIRGKDVQGYYRPATGVLRTKKKNDVEILAHEMAHYLDLYSKRDGLPDFAKLYESRRYREEVMGLSYTDKSVDLQMKEGFAEFVRLWLTNNVAAKQQAPAFFRAFDQALRTEPKLNRRMKHLRAMMHNYYYQGHLGRLEAGIGHYPSLMHRFDEWWYRRHSRIRQQVLDSGEALRRVELELTKKIGKAEASAWKLARLAKGGYREVAAHFLNYGTLNWSSDGGGMDITGKSLREVFSPIKQVKLKPEHRRLAADKFSLLMQYFKAKRAVELHAQGRERQVNLGDAKRTVALESVYPEFETIFDDFQEFNSRMLDFYQESGLVSEDSRKAIEEMNKSYVPFHRVREYLGGAKAPRGGFQRLTGGTANTEDILINIQDGLVENVRAAMMNRSKQALYHTIEKYEDGAVWASKIPPRSEKITVNEDEIREKIRRVLKDMGVIDPEAEENPVIDLSQPDLLQFWRHGMPPGAGDSGNLIDSVMIEGKTKYYEVRDPLLTEYLQSLDPVSVSAWIRAAHAVKNIFTRSVTLGLQFMGANFVMDSTSGFTYTKNRGYLPLISSMVGMYDFFTRNANYQAFIRSGGGGSSLEATTRQGSARRTVAVDEFGVMSIPDRVLATIDRLATASEYGTRIAEFKLSRKAGKSDFEAAFNAREISTDYNVIGANHFLANFFRSIHFFNAALQSMDRLYREFKTQRKGGNVVNFVTRSALGVMLPTIMLYLYNREDETYNDEPVHKRLKNWYIPIGTYPNGRTKYVTLPRPYDAGHLFGSLPEIMVEYMFQENDTRAVHDFWWVMSDMFALDATPSVAMGFSDVLLNKDWKGAPVVPVQYQDITPRDQFDAQTSETFYKLGQALNISPMKAEHMYSSSFGYLGGYLLHAMDHLLWDESSFGEKANEPLTGSKAGNAAIERFITPAVRPYIRETSEFFEIKRQSDEVFKTFGANADERRAITGRMADIGFQDDPLLGLTKEEKAVLYGLNDALNDVTSSLFGREGLKTVELTIMYNENLSAEEKREQLDALWQSRNEMLKSAFTPIRKQLEEAKKVAAKRKKADQS